MTFSLHKYGDFFPGTGHITDTGAKEGIGFSVNAPLNNGITDDDYFDSVFQPVLEKIMAVFQPGAVVLQCGADSLASDRLGCFNLTTHGHAKCVTYVKSFNVPMLVLGGGGYTIRNVARCWAYETAVLLDQPNISNDIPYNDYYEYYSPDYLLHLPAEPNMENLNTKELLDSVRIDLLQQVSEIKGAPSVAMQQVPPLFQRRIEGANNDINDTDVDRQARGMSSNQHEKNDDNPDMRDVIGKNSSGDGTRRAHPCEFYDNVD
jgi:histone deacetylase 1/2